MTLAAGFLVEAASDYVVVVLTVTHGYNAVRGHRTGSNSSCGMVPSARYLLMMNKLPNY